MIERATDHCPIRSVPLVYVRRTSVCLFHPVVDFLFLGGWSIVVMILCFLLPLKQASFFYFFFTVGWFINGPHFAATFHKVYSDRTFLKSSWVSAFLLPVLGLIVIGFVYLNQELIQYYIKIYIYWSSYHYAGQTFGVTLLLLKKNRVTSEARRYLYLSTLGIACCGIILHELSPSYQFIFDVKMYSLVLPSYVFYVTQSLTGIFLGLFVLHLVGPNSLSSADFPWLAMVPILSLYFWFLIGPKNELFYAFVPVAHSLQYLYVVWVRRREQSFAPDEKNWSSLIWFFSIFLIAMGIFRMLPIGINLLVSEGVILSILIFFGIQMHHFYLDGLIWKGGNQWHSA